MKENITVYTTIASDEGDVKLSAGLDTDKNLYYMPYLHFKKSHELGKQTWDNGTFVFETFYPMLMRWKNRTLTKEDELNFKAELKLSDDDLTMLIDIIEIGISMGWDKLD